LSASFSLLSLISSTSGHLIPKKSSYGITRIGCGVNLVVTGQQPMPLPISVMNFQLTHFLVIKTVVKATAVSILMATLGTIVAPTLTVTVITDGGEVSVIEGEDTMINTTNMIKAISPKPTTVLLPTMRHIPTATSHQLTTCSFHAGMQDLDTVKNILQNCVDAHYDRKEAQQGNQESAGNQD
jgi:hypothetical protein